MADNYIQWKKVKFVSLMKNMTFLQHTLNIKAYSIMLRFVENSCLLGGLGAKIGSLAIFIKDWSFCSVS